MMDVILSELFYSLIFIGAGICFGLGIGDHLWNNEDIDDGDEIEP